MARQIQTRICSEVLGGISGKADKGPAFSFQLGRGPCLLVRTPTCCEQILFHRVPVTVTNSDSAVMSPAGRPYKSRAIGGYEL